MLLTGIQVYYVLYYHGHTLTWLPRKGGQFETRTADYGPRIARMTGALGPLHTSPVDRAGSVTGMNFALGSYEKFQPGFRDEKRSKILGTSSGAKFGKQNKQIETQKF